MGPIDRSLLRALPGARRAVFRLAVVGVASGVVALIQAVSVAWMVAALVASQPLARPLILLGSVLVGRGVLAGVAEVVDRRAGHEVSGAVRLRLVRSWLERPVEQRPSHDHAVSLAGAGVASIEPYVARYLPALVLATVVPILAVAVMAFVDPVSAVILIVTLPLLPLFAALIGKHTADESERRWSAMRVMAGHFLDVVRGLPTLVAYGRADHQVGVVRTVGDRHRWASVDALRTAFLSSAALELLATISVAMVAVAVGLRLAYGAMDLQVALTAILLAPEAYWPIRRVGQEFHNAADGASVVGQIGPELVAAEGTGPSVETSGPESTDTVSVDPVSVETVCFAYPDRPLVLDGVSFSTPSGPGLTILRGESGRGKSTLLDLLAGIRSTQAGSVIAPPAHLATQRPLLLSATVGSALRLGRPEALDDECRQALEAVGLWSALESREGLQTQLGDDGFGLSAGQRSRLALARAKLSAARLILLDEPTAHVDGNDLGRLRQLIGELATTRRVIVATHDRELVALGDSQWDLSSDQPLENPDVAVGADVRVEPNREKTTDRVGDPVPSLSRWQQWSVRHRLTLACLLGGLSMTAGVALTATSGWLIVQASTQPVVLTLMVAIVGVRAFGIARPVLRYCERVVSHDAALETLTDRRVDLYRSLIPLTPARLGRRRRSDLLGAIVTDLDDAVDHDVRVTVPWWSTAMASAIAVMIVLVVLPPAALVLALGSVAVFVVARMGSRREQVAQGEAVQSRAEVLGVTTDLVDGLDAIRAVTGADPAGYSSLLGSIKSSHEAQGNAENRLILRRAYTQVSIWLVLAMTTVGVALVAAWGLDEGMVSGPLAALVALGPVALADGWVGLAEVGGANARSQQAETRLAAVLDQEPAVHDSGTMRLPNGVLPVTAEAIGAVWVEGQQTLGPFTLPTLEPGTRAQISGPNGVGKSTMLAVLARHLNPVEGTHLLAGHRAGHVGLADARADIAIVSDEPHAFSGSIRANLLLAAPEATDDEIVRALGSADLHRWLARQPQGLDTALVGLSGGERARLAIARAVLSRRRLVLLDEPTAHLDDATAARALDGLVGDQSRAIVAVSHRPLDLAQGDRFANYRPWAAMAAPTIPALFKK